MTAPVLDRPRPLSEFESLLVSRLIELARDSRIAFSPNEFSVRLYSDNAPGSFLLVKRGEEMVNQEFGRELVRGEFTDIDGVSVSVALNLDSNDVPFEVDIWKVDDTAVLQWPSLNQIQRLDVVDSSLH